MNLTSITLSNTRTGLVLYFALLCLGLSSYFSMGRQEYPDFTIRNAQIITRYPGRTALQVEQEVTEPIEQIIRQMPEMKEVKSTSKNGVSIISAELEESYFDLDPIWQRLRNKVSAVQLPDGAGIPDVNDEFGDVFPYIYALRGDGFTPRELTDYAELIRDELLALDGVAKVEFHGSREERVYVDLSSSEIAAFDVSMPNIAAQLSEQNATSPSGSMLIGPERSDVVTLGEYESLKELRDTRLSIPGRTSSLLLSDIADIQRAYEDPIRSLAHFNGERVLCIAVSMIEGGVVTKIGERIEAKLDELQQELPWGLDIERSFYQPQYVDQSIRSFLVNLGQAFGFVALVMFLFAGWRIATIVAILVPSAVLLCFAAMPLLDVQLEMMSIAALIIALGLLVDNAVVVSEQILVRLGAGQDRLTACREACGNLTVPLLAASGTTIAAFSPIALAPGGTSEFTYSLFAVVTLTLLASWILSLSVIPLFCYWLLKPLERETLVGRVLQRLYRPYEAFLRWTLHRRLLFPVVILFATMVAAWGFGFVPSIFFPPNERGQFVIDFELPRGKSIEETEKRVTDLERWLLQERKEQVKSVSSWIGNGGPRWYLSLSPEPANPNYAFLSVLTHSEDPNDVRNLVDAVNAHALEIFPDARVRAKALENGPPVGAAIQMRLYGPDMKTLYDCRDRITSEIASISGLEDVRDDWGAWVKQIAVRPDLIRTARLGLTTSTISAALNTQYQGLTATHYRDGEDSIPVVLRSQDDYRSRPERIADLPIYGAEVGVVPLGQVARVAVEFLPGTILREDTLRVMTIKAEVRGRFASEVLAEIRPRMSDLTSQGDWPKDYFIEYGGEQEESAEAQGQIGSVMPISLAFLALILIGQFNSLRRFGIILLTVPPMLIGVTIGLLVTGSSFGFMTMLGMIALLGIVVNNAILLIDEINRQRAEGLELNEAIVSSATSRLRPIIMTTVTTIIGLMPLAISGGGMWSSMANAMMFGLGFATLLTLVLCPILFSLFFRDPKPVAAPVPSDSTSEEETDPRDTVDPGPKS